MVSRKVDASFCMNSILLMKLKVVPTKAKMPLKDPWQWFSFLWWIEIKNLLAAVDILPEGALDNPIPCRNSCGS
jgi:hypothetical protein